ncbi:serine carboxypeptidase-like 51 [Panicum virgatum]|uniref:Uncharacterized protein n=1 Tax=Panicum virgatum TaxID=38727 RepID=A0A8T0T835_PANVG|nr:serine carboxypeptidase-like 51 [Panicum virgatum]XP_039806853.1 serine carboxypeptidase-like 51 [Panicum virgatum]XP_039806854.1 serine carboxypeptidase-like 51 [Panicum virgatum]KAG2606457.1 hypothetical protein PVAP13_4NG031411 [Panicum virgatum]
MSRLDDNAVPKTIMMAVELKKQVAAGQFAAALKTLTDQLDLINNSSGRVNIKNIMIDNTMSSVLLDLQERHSVASRSQATSSSPNTISGIMNGIIKQKLKIVPKDVIWQEASLQVFDALSNDFMKPAINEVDELLAYGVNVTVYNGQFDILCSTLGAEAWVRRLKWDGLHKFLSLPRKTMHYCHPYSLTNAFVRSYKNLNFYWVLAAGHTVPVDQPCTAVHMISSIVQSPAN